MCDDPAMERRGDESGMNDGVAGCGSGSPLPSVREKNKLPGEAVPEPGARWDWCASVLPRKEPDTACIQRGDKHHFRGDRFDLPCIPLGGGCRRIVQGCVGREASDATLPTMTARPDRCDRGSLLQKTSACFKSGPAVQGTDRLWRFCLLPDLTLAKANWKSKSIKVLSLNNVLANQILGSGHGRHRAKKKFLAAAAGEGHRARPAASGCAEWGFPGTRRAGTRRMPAPLPIHAGRTGKPR